MLAIIMLLEYIPGGKLSLLERAINRNLLAVFIIVRKKDSNFADWIGELIYRYPVCVTAYIPTYLDWLQFYRKLKEIIRLNPMSRSCQGWEAAHLLKDESILSLRGCE